MFLLTRLGFGISLRTSLENASNLRLVGGASGIRTSGDFLNGQYAMSKRQLVAVRSCLMIPTPATEAAVYFVYISWRFLRALNRLKAHACLPDFFTGPLPLVCPPT